MKTWKRMVLSALVGGLGCLTGYAVPHLGALLHKADTQTHVQANVQEQKADWQTHVQANVQAQAAVSPLPGGVAPDFALVDALGKQHRLSELRGKPVLVNFWASWCGYCREEMPALKQTADRNYGRLQVVGVNIADQDTPEAAHVFLQKYHINYLNLYDNDGAVSKQYQLRVVPTTLLLDGRGVVVDRYLGPLTEDKLAQWLKKVQI